MSRSEITERIVARLTRGAEGELSNPKVEQYALLRAEEVVTPSAAWTICMASEKGNLPSGSYQANIHKSPAFKARLDQLMSEKQRLEEDGVWGRLEWQARQLYRKAAAMNDLRGMQQATDTLLKIAQRNEKPPEKKPEDETPKREGPGAPTIETPLETAGDDFMARRLIER